MHRGEAPGAGDGRGPPFAETTAALAGVQSMALDFERLRRVPRRALSTRAELAVRIAAAHRVAAIEHRLPYERQVQLPF